VTTDPCDLTIDAHASNWIPEVKYDRFQNLEGGVQIVVDVLDYVTEIREINTLPCYENQRIAGVDHIIV
jgi:hypothetical protein